MSNIAQKTTVHYLASVITRHTRIAATYTPQLTVVYCPPSIISDGRRTEQKLTAHIPYTPSLFMMCAYLLLISHYVLTGFIVTNNMRSFFTANYEPIKTTPLSSFCSPNIYSSYFYFLSSSLLSRRSHYISSLHS